MREFESGEWTMAELCRTYEISRQSGYKWVKRVRGEGDEGLEDRSRAPRSHPNQTSAKVEQQLLDLRQRHKSWGPRKLLYTLRQEAAANSLAGGQHSKGIVKARRTDAGPGEVRRKMPPYTQPFQKASEPNQLWCGDFKGWFRTQDGQRIDPLTMSDASSRFLLRCQAVDKANTEQVIAINEAAFREYGLPLAIRTDNGPPFASRAVCGISVL